VTNAPPVLRALTVEFGVEAGRLIIRVGGREDVIARVADSDRANLVMGELERWIIYRIGNAAYELADRLRSPAFAAASPVGPLAAPSPLPVSR
jgi:hypothetical protein